MIPVAAAAEGTALGRLRRGEALAYAAGYLEGEGCFTPKRRKSSVGLLIQARSTDIEPLRWLHEQYGGSIRGPYAQPNPRAKEQYHWALQGDPAGDLMRKLKPFMSRRRQAAIQFALDERQAYEESA